MKAVKNIFFPHLLSGQWSDREHDSEGVLPHRVFLPACICSVSWQHKRSFGQSQITLTRLLRAVQRRQLNEQTTWKFSNYGNRLKFWNGCWNTITWIKGYTAIKYDSKFRVWTQDFVSFRFCTLSSEMHSTELTKSTKIQTNPFPYWGLHPAILIYFLFIGWKIPIGFRRCFRSKTEAFVPRFSVHVFYTLLNANNNAATLSGYTHLNQHQNSFMSRI